MSEEHTIKVRIADKHGSTFSLAPAEARKFVIDSVQGGYAWVYFGEKRIPLPPKQIPQSRNEKAIEDAFPMDLFDGVSVVRILPGLVGGGGQKQILVIGSGGIGSLLVEHLAKVAAFTETDTHWPSAARVAITLMDGDIVEERNLPHQQFRARDVGKPKVEAITRQLRNAGISKQRGVELLPVVENFSADTDLSNYDLVVVAVDREEPRNLVHANAKHWLDLRARGDGFVMWSYQDDLRVLDSLPKLPEGTSTSCQLEDAVESGNIQFGFALAAAHGAQWIVQWLRGASVPSGKMYSIHMGELPLPEISQEAVE